MLYEVITIFARIFGMLVTLGMCTETAINFEGVERHGETYTAIETYFAFSYNFV